MPCRYVIKTADVMGKICICSLLIYALRKISTLSAMKCNESENGQNASWLKQFDECQCHYFCKYLCHLMKLTFLEYHEIKDQLQCHM
jgi:hypothetical protein